MTNLQIIQIALRRVGLNTSSSVFKDSARDYMNMIAQDIASREKWNWLFKSSTFNCSVVVGLSLYCCSVPAYTIPSSVI